MNYNKYSVILLLSVVIAFTAGCTKADNKPEARTEAAPIEQPAVEESMYTKAADFTMSSLEGTPVSLSDYKGKVIILDFWATWCPPCVKEIPHFIELYDQYKNQGVVVIGVSVDQGGKPAVDKFVQKTPVNYPIVLEDNDPQFKTHTIKDSGSFLKVLANSGDGVNSHIRTKLSASVKNKLNSGENSPEILAEVLSEINGLMKAENLFSRERFSGIDLGVDIERIEGYQPSPEQMEGFNRFLLDGAWRDHINPKASQTYQSYLAPDERGGIPYTFVIDRDGNIRDHFVGYRPKEVFEELIKKLI